MKGIRLVLQIPKVIHYCWFGNNPLGEKEHRCLKSWKKYLPDYKIKRWDESNFSLEESAYASEAYNEQKWAFVSDYARFKILYEYGGIYFDTDVEVIRSLDDLLDYGALMGCESDASNCPWEDLEKGDTALTVNPGLILVAPPKMSLYREIVDIYQNRSFYKADGSCDLSTVVELVTNLLKQYGLKNESGIQKIRDIYIYPKDYFNPKDFWTGKIEITNNTRSIHHFAMSWFSPEMTTQRTLYSWLKSNKVPTKYAWNLAVAASIIRHMDIKRLINGLKHIK